MAKRRGFFAELAYQQKQATQAAQRQALYNAKMAEINADHQRREREFKDRMEQSRTESEARSREWAAVAQRQAEEFEALNVAAADLLSGIDSLLSFSVERPPFRIDSLAAPAAHPPFDAADLVHPLAKPLPQAGPPEPVYQPPPPPQGMAKMFSKKQFLEAEQAAKSKWQQEHDAWTTYVQQTLPAHNQKVREQYEANERHRLERLASARDAYTAGCAAREEAASADAKRVQEFKALVVANDADAVLEFIEAILENSRYPEAFTGSFEVNYDAESREATIKLYVPDPASMPTVKAYKKLVTTGEVRAVSCTQAEQRNRYNTAVAAAALRVLHELFSAEPAEVVETASVTVGTETVDPATGQVRLFHFVEAAAAREDLLQYNLTQVEPAQTLGHMGAVVSKNAFALKAVSDVRGIRK